MKCAHMQESDRDYCVQRLKRSVGCCRRRIRAGAGWALARLQLDDYFLAIELCHLELTVRGVEQRWEDDLMDEVGLDVELRHRRDDGDDGAHDD